MPIFGGLANETLLQIIKETSADDIAALASCCKQLHFLAQERLAFHRQKRAEADDIIVGWDMWETSAIHPSKHLQDILEDDDSRFYTKVMKIGSLAYGDPVDDVQGDEGTSHVRDKDDLLENIEVQYKNQITTLVTKVYSTLLPYAAKTRLNKWIDEVIDGEPAAVVILLLALYPNLELLYVYEPGQDWWKEEDLAELPWGNIFRSMTTTAMEPANNTLRIFSKLSDFRLMGLEEEGMEASAEILTPFMALPTMRSILGHVVDGRDIHWPYNTATSEVTVLDLEGDIDTDSLSTFIRGLKALKHFRYQFSSPVACIRRAYGGKDLNRLKWGPRASHDFAYNESDEDDSGEDNWGIEHSDMDINYKPRWEPRAITASLLQHACNTLVSLDLTAAGFKGAVEFPNDEPFIGSLRSFRVLKHVCLDTMMVFKKVKCCNNVSLIRGKSIRQKSWEEIRVQWLVDFLPMTIETFEMTCKYVGKGLSKGDVAAMFTGLPELRNRLPNLFEITLEREKDGQSDKEKKGWKELCVRCEENVIDLFLKVV